MPYGLKDNELEKLNALFATNKKVEKVILYGSRAKGTYRPFSDVDITLVGDALTHDDITRIDLAIDDLLLPYQFDISVLGSIKNQDLLDPIARRGITIYSSE